MLSAKEILKMIEPGEMFPNDAKAVKAEYVKLARLWHPDCHGHSEEANAVMAKINTLYKECLEMIKAGNYRRPGFIEILGTDGKTREVRYRVSHTFELGTAYVGNGVILYLVDGAHLDMVENARKVISSLKYADDGMRKEVSRYLPEIVATFETTDNQFGVVVKKTPDLFLLGDVLRYLGGRVPPRHVAWVMSSMYNLACYLDYARLSHNAIALDTYFISPVHHNGSLLGGWWYSVPQGGRMIGVPDVTYSVMPPHVKSGRCGSILTDLESIRRVGRELLGDSNGTRLTVMGDVPKPMVDWLRGAASDDAFAEYSEWRRVLNASFGERKFVEMKIDADGLYASKEG